MIDESTYPKIPVNRELLLELTEDAEQLSALFQSIGLELRGLEEREAKGVCYFGDFHSAAALTRLGEKVANEAREGLESILHRVGLESLANQRACDGSDDTLDEAIEEITVQPCGGSPIDQLLQSNATGDTCENE